MEEKISSFCHGKKSADHFATSPQKSNTTQALYFPVYIVTSSFNSSHLPLLQKQLQKQKIVLSFQKSTEKFKKVQNTHQKRLFVVFSDLCEIPASFSSENQDEYQIVNYPSINVQKVITLYRQFVAQQLNKINCVTNLASKIQATIIKSQLLEGVKNSQQQAMRQKSLVKFKNVSKIVNNYKTTWRKKLFIYSNKHDDQVYSKYVSFIQSMSFEDVCFIGQIQEYIRFLPDKDNVSFCILMSQYSALNLRKFFKNVDEIILLGINTEKCAPLLRGKVTFFTTEIESLDKLLIEKFGMKEKKLVFSVNSIKSFNSDPKNKLKISEEDIYNYKSKDLDKQNDDNIQRNQLKFRSLPRNLPNLTISPQYCIINQPIRSLLLQSNITDLNYCFDPLAMSGNIMNEREKKQLNIKTQYNICKRDQPLLLFTIKEIIENISPLKIVHLQMASLANISIKSSEISYERKLFQELIDKMNNQASIAQFKVDESQLGNHSQARDEKKLSYKQNSINSLRSSQSSRFSNGSSHNSRIVNRIKQIRAKNGQNIKAIY